MGVRGFWLSALVLSGQALGLVGGIPAKTNQIPSVFIWTTSDSGLDSTYCTASKVAADWMLTAAHCVLEQKSKPEEPDLGPWREIPSMKPGREFKYSFSRSLRQDWWEETLTIRQVVLPKIVRQCLANPGKRPEVCERDVPLADIALVQVVPEGGFRKAPIAKTRRGPVAAGTPVLLLGYGAEGEDDENPRLSFQWANVSDWNVLKQALSTTLARRLGFPSPYFFFGVYSAFQDKRHVNLGSGDSGGPVFDAKTAEIIGVNSDGFCELNRPGCEVATNSFFARLDVLESWPIP